MAGTHAPLDDCLVDAISYAETFRGRTPRSQSNSRRLFRQAPAFRGLCPDVSNCWTREAVVNWCTLVTPRLCMIQLPMEPNNLEGGALQMIYGRDPCLARPTPCIYVTIFTQLPWN
ncbi:hypothetical protein RSAG8_13429, partial [Rhizoctonia solani AG-8 WAC10335]